MLFGLFGSFFVAWCNVTTLNLVPDGFDDGSSCIIYGCQAPNFDPHTSLFLGLSPFFDPSCQSHHSPMFVVLSSISAGSLLIQLHSCYTWISENETEEEKSACCIINTGTWHHVHSVHNNLFYSWLSYLQILTNLMWAFQAISQVPWGTMHIFAKNR